MIKKGKKTTVKNNRRKQMMNMMKSKQREKIQRKQRITKKVEMTI